MSGTNHLLSKTRYHQLECAELSDPFSILGPQFDNDDLLNVWMPGAINVSLVLDDGQTIALSQPHHGAFVLSSSHALKDLDLTARYYELAIEWQSGVQQIADPYQFHNIYPSKAALLEPSSQYKEMGAQLLTVSRDGKEVTGVRFVVYAPNASTVSVIGDFNSWDGRRHPLQRMDDGLWGLFVPSLSEGERYKFELKDSTGNLLPNKADPWGYDSEQYPSFASKVYNQQGYQWKDSAWCQREVTEKHTEALSFYELHAGSWRRDHNGDFLNYRQLADQLVPYLVEMGYTHVELMPISEHPFYGSWGYQTIGMFSPTSRYGSPDDFKYFVDQCHQAGVGVVLDWVPAHFPSDEHGLANFDGTALFNDPDPRRGWHQDWKSYIYDYGREHVRRFLVANALYWLDNFHIDGLRVDAVASMLYLDYSREHDQWIPNRDGGNHNYDAIDLLKWVNLEAYRHYPNVMTIAEESTAFDGVSRPVDLNGLGFGFKWNMGWMHDSLAYFQEESVHRKWHHDTITFPLVYAFSENYVLSLSHDEVVYGKGAIANKMPGDEWQQMANARAYYGYMYGMPGKKLNFMGAEFGQKTEWNHDAELDWSLLEQPQYQGMQNLTRDLNQVYRQYPALHQLDCSDRGFEWRVELDRENSILAWERLSEQGEQRVLVAANLTPDPKVAYRIGVPLAGRYELILNSDAEYYNGSQYPVTSDAVAEAIAVGESPFSIVVNLPPLSTQYWLFHADK
ncbi:1,4-alpha-glucan branching protein GlgB [Vibrio sp. SS-MA-C1-2]|uniref:1,4-alpha-glucan branching protein GlgB n=1 Tax=Vibrio sp. SS-MA-C1-2 TaxID=2908646 RepID=UPI001F286302|nr:1,4-alpha-glucan branching protein GlgB [Vibrio sp. SS-MA-C1-2]UJF17497.1 1,4-alpha-glucan branching protein GlgB [Vibrio sp. SS-MA-C1-2]